MNFREELIQRCAAARRDKLGGLSDAAFEELLLAVRANVEAFIENPSEQALSILARAMERYAESQHDDDLLDDDEYMAERTRRFEAIKAAATQALQVDPASTDAKLLLAQATTAQPDKLLDLLLAIEAEAERGARGDAGAASEGAGGATFGESGPAAGTAAGDGRAADRDASEALNAPAGGAGTDVATESEPRPQAAAPKPFSALSWSNVADRPRLRVRAAIARCCGDGARWKMARDAAESVLAQTADDGDPLGARHTAAVAYARLEDEEGLNALEARFSQGSAWSNLARCVLLYKLGRIPAARRALRGYAQLNDGAAYALLRPIFVEVYLPDRPDYPKGSFEEALCAVHETEVVIADTPDFVAWAQSQDWFEAEARDYADRHDLDW